MKRNCSLSPRQTMAAYGALVGPPFVIALAFGVASGVWLVLPFAFIHATGFLIAFLSYARHSGDRERLVLLEDLLIVEVDRACRQRTYTMRRSRAAVTLSADGMIHAEDGTQCIEFGRHLDVRERAHLVRELSSLLHAWHD